ncbi:MAG: glycosyltransferase family 2 protein [Alphaproteobacteria bacterium]|nr:glycosyltransferase family 2 protein [Alphaproteobacteria bacterium]
MVLPLSVLVTVKNEAKRIDKCIAGLQGRFGQVVVIDSESGDGTAEKAAHAGAEVVSYRWNGRYPKKRQWCLENLRLKYDWVFFLDADEEITPDFWEELSRIDWKTALAAGFFVKSVYVWKGRVLRHGLKNNKLCILHRARLAFPEVDDLDIPGMGEIEGHYQPLRKPGFEDAPLGQIRAPILHHTLEDEAGWQARHERYARWEAGMDEKGAWPQDPVWTRRWLKALFKALPCRGNIAFLHSFILKGGFRDGRAGLALARSRRDYYRAISRLKAR